MPDAMKRPRPRLDRETVLDAAQAVAEHDAGVVSMRRVGAQLGADPTAVYRHFRSKDELMAVLADRLFAPVAFIPPTGNWQEDLRAIMLTGWRVYRAHPDLAQTLANLEEDSPNLTRVTERVLGVLREAGLGDADCGLMHDVAVAFVAGSGMFEALAEGGGQETWRADARRGRRALHPDEFPNTVELADSLYNDADEVFELGVRIIIAAIEWRANPPDGTSP